IPASQLFNFHTPRTSSDDPMLSPTLQTAPTCPCTDTGEGGGGRQGGRGRASIELAMVDAALRESAAAAAAGAWAGGVAGAEAALKPSLPSPPPPRMLGEVLRAAVMAVVPLGCWWYWWYWWCWWVCGQGAFRGYTRGGGGHPVSSLPNAAGAGRKKNKGRQWAAAGAGIGTSAGAAGSSSGSRANSAAAGGGRPWQQFS
ncbi:hypothetical protein CLOP_g14631, partial [Closterium sp. NIES-67]